MFCYIKYAEWDEVQQIEFFSKATSVISKFSNIKCTIPENKILLVNPNCYIKILIDYVAEQVKFDFDCASLDFCNENGELLKVNDMRPCDYAINVMHAQKTYIVVKCFRNEEGIIKSIEPLLFKYSKEYTDVLPRLKKYMSSRKHLERKKKGIDDLGRAGRSTKRSSEDNIFRGSSIASRGSRRTIPSISSGKQMAGLKSKPSTAT